jgi:hypothetical protein
MSTPYEKVMLVFLQHTTSAEREINNMSPVEQAAGW